MTSALSNDDDPASASSVAPTAPPNLDEVNAAVDVLQRVRTEVTRCYQGNTTAINLLLVALMAGGHALLEGVPGVAKTTLVKALAQTLGCEMRRIQFTPDLLPQDITGTNILNPKTGEFSLRKGPIFAELVLADEINRAPARTQSALLEAMQERQVTIEGERLALPDPFLVLATQNPLDLEGTFPLPEAQIDRFMIQIQLDYPSPRSEVEMLRKHAVRTPSAARLLNPATCRHLQALATRVHVEDDLLEYATNLSRFTRQHPRVILGCSPRATLNLVRATKAYAILSGRPYATPDDMRAIAPATLAHRLILVPELESDPRARTTIIEEMLAQVSFQHPIQSKT